jgi:hypothetical protein
MGCHLMFFRDHRSNRTAAKLRRNAHSAKSYTSLAREWDGMALPTIAAKTNNQRSERRDEAKKEAEAGKRPQWLTGAWVPTAVGVLCTGR